MFRELYAVARHTPLTLIVTPHKTDAGNELHVIVIPKPGDDAPEESALHKPLSFIGTPEELDTFTAEALANIEAYTAGVNVLRVKLDLPTEAVAAEAAEKVRSSTPRPASPAGKKNPIKKSPAKAPAKAPAAAKKPGTTSQREPAGGAPAGAANASAPDTTGSHPQRSEAAPGSAGTTTGDSSVATDGATPSRPAASTPTAQTSDHPAAASTTATAKPPRHPDLLPRLPKIDRASREQCIEDGRAYLVAIGAAKPSRELFVRWAITGRRYEKLWKNFAEFLDEVRRVNTATVTLSEEQWPFPRNKGGLTDEPFPPQEPTATALHTGGEQPPAYSAPAAPSPIIRTIHTTTGLLLGSSMKPLTYGDRYTHDEFGDWRVVATTDKSITVEGWTDEPPADKPVNNGDLLEGLATTQGA